uniref:Uncharacterized protein n=1 Tax=Setaria italica TaxID=4555 RepID=K3ZKR3_SETIT
MRVRTGAPRCGRSGLTDESPPKLRNQMRARLELRGLIWSPAICFRTSNGIFCCLLVTSRYVHNYIHVILFQMFCYL